MKKFVIALMLCLAVLTSIEFFHTDVAYAASKKAKKSSTAKSHQPVPRNLLDEYFNALKRDNIKKAISILNEGLNVSDATEATFVILKAKVRGIDLKDTNSVKWGKATNSFIGGLAAMIPEKIYPQKLSNAYVQSCSELLRSLKQKGANFSAASDYDMFFETGVPENLFKVLLEVTNKKVFTGKEISAFLLCYERNRTGIMDEALKKLGILKNFGAKIDRSNSSDGIVAKVLENVMPGWVDNYYIRPQEVSYLAKIYNLLKELGVNAGPKERSFWQVMSTKTPWEILNDYREDHRNEPEIIQRCNEIEKILPPVGN